MSAPDDNPDTSSDDGPLVRFLAAIGGQVVDIVDVVVGNFQLLGLTLYYVFRGGGGQRRRRAVIEQLHEIGNRSLLFVAVVMGFLGMILVFQAGYQAQRITGDLRMLGPLFLQLLLREFGPTITAMMVATRVGSGMAAHIGSMVVTEQVDALRMSAAQPVNYLVVPRFLASAVMMVVLAIFGSVVSFGVGAVTANIAYGVNYYTFVDVGMVGWFDLIIGLVKSLAYGLAVPIAACHAGLNVFGGSAGVGRATTTAVVNASLAVVILDFLLSGLGYFVLALI